MHEMACSPMKDRSFSWGGFELQQEHGGNTDLRLNYDTTTASSKTVSKVTEVGNV